MKSLHIERVGSRDRFRFRLEGVIDPAGARSLDRLLFETSSYYLLGVAPDQLDLDGKTHELRVRVERRGVNIRVRKFVVLRPTS